MTFQHTTWGHPVTYKSRDIKPTHVLYIPGFQSGTNPQYEAIGLLKELFPTCSVTNLAWEGPASNQPQECSGSLFQCDTVDDSLYQSWTSYASSLDSLKQEVGHKTVQKVFTDAIQKMTSVLPFPMAPSQSVFSPIADIFKPVQNLFSPVLNPIKEVLPFSFLERWEKAKSDTNKVAKALSQKISKMTIDKRFGLLLVGHSLGANIVIKTLSLLDDLEIKINQALLLGAAIDNNDPNIPKAWNAVLNPINSTINPLDHALMAYMVSNGASALGSTGYSGTKNNDTSHFIELYLDPDGIENLDHSCCYYIQQWEKHRLK